MLQIKEKKRLEVTKQGVENPKQGKTIIGEM